MKSVMTAFLAMLAGACLGAVSVTASRDYVDKRTKLSAVTNAEYGVVGYTIGTNTNSTVASTGYVDLKVGEAEPGDYSNVSNAAMNARAKTDLNVYTNGLDGTSVTNIATGDRLATTGDVAVAMGSIKTDLITDGTNTIDAARNVFAYENERYSDWHYDDVPSGYSFHLQWISEEEKWDWYILQDGGENYEDGSIDDKPENATNMTIITSYATVKCTRTYMPEGIMVIGKLALTNDIPPSVTVVAPSMNATSGTAADAKATGTALYTGFTEWEFGDGGTHVITGPFDGDGWWYYELDHTYGDLNEFQTEAEALAATSLEFAESQTATRHLITPTKTSQLTNDGSNGVPFVVGTQLGTKQDALPYPTNSIPFAAISGAPTSPSMFYDAAGGEATVSGATLTYQAASNSVGSVALLAGTNVLHITAPSAITGYVRDFGLTVSTEDAATITLDQSVSWRFDAASTNLAAGSWNRVYCTESPSGVFSLQLWTPDSAQEATP